MSSDDSNSYYLHTRSEIEPLLPGSAERILEIGCGSGATLKWLKARWPSAVTVGVDGFEPALASIKKNADAALIVDLDHELPDMGRFDLILALDVLEHLKNPDMVLKGLVGHLSPGGTIIVSVPNVAHFSILSDLVLRRRFDYQEAGILDRTHLRFFTEHSAIRLLTDAGLRVVGGVVNGLDGPRASAFNTLTFGVFKHYLVKQYIMAGSLDEARTPLSWKPSVRP